jgi:hypothetical protein
VGGRGSQVGVIHMVLLVRVVVVWDRRLWVVAVRPQGGTRRPSMEGVIVLRKWGEGSPLSVRARPPWAVVVLRWGASPYMGGQRSWMGGAVNVHGHSHWWRVVLLLSLIVGPSGKGMGVVLRTCPV